GPRPGRARGHASDVGGRLPRAHGLRGRDRVSELALTARQIRYTNKAFWRNPAAAFFTFVFPLMFLVIFATLLGSGTVTLENGAEFDQSTYYVASMSILLVVICAAFGWIFYNADLPTGMNLIRSIVVVLVGSASFAALGLALTPAIPNADAAPPIVNATILPLL